MRVRAHPLQLGLELLGVDEVAVVRQRDAERRVHVERLRLGRARRAGGRVAHVPDTHVAGEGGDVILLEDVADHTILLAQAQPSRVFRHDACRILPAVLQRQERFVEHGDRRGALGDDDTGNAAHGAEGSRAAAFRGASLRRNRAASARLRKKKS